MLNTVFILPILLSFSFTGKIYTEANFNILNLQVLTNKQFLANKKTES